MVWLLDILIRLTTNDYKTNVVIDSSVRLTLSKDGNNNGYTIILVKTGLVDTILVVRVYIIPIIGYEFLLTGVKLLWKIIWKNIMKNISFFILWISSIS